MNHLKTELRELEEAIAFWKEKCYYWFIPSMIFKEIKAQQENFPGYSILLKGMPMYLFILESLVKIFTKKNIQMPFIG